MADLPIAIPKKVVQLVAERVKSAIKEEEEQWQIVQRDLVFITDEFEMTQSFLNSADGKRIMNHVVRTWVRQVRDLSHDVEDCIEFVLHLDTDKRPWWRRRSWWLRLPPSCCRMVLPVDEAVAEITQLKARVVDVGQRNTRYNLISDDDSGSSKTPTPATPSAFRTLTVDAGAAPTDRSLSDISEVMDRDDKSRRVISVCGASRGDREIISVIRKLYDKGRTRKDFQRRAWVKLVHPFNPHDFIRSLMTQFLASSSQDEEAVIGVAVLTKLETIQGNLLNEFANEVKTHTYFIVLEDMSSMEQWDAIKTYLPDRRNASRVIVSTHLEDIATLCTGKPYRVSMLQQPSSDQPYHVFHHKKEQRWGGVTEPPQQPSLGAGLFVGRDVEANDLLGLVKRHRHVSVWGPPGVGKTALVKDVHEKSAELFPKRRYWADVSHPFEGEGLAHDLIVSGLLQSGAQEVQRHLQRITASAADGKLVRRCRLTLNLSPDKYMVVIDGVRSKRVWDWIKTNITGRTQDGCCVVTVTADESIARYCAETSGGEVYRVNSLDAPATLGLFRKKAPFIKKDEPVLSKCTGLPKFIVTLSQHLEKQPTERRDTEIRHLNDNFMHQLDNIPEFHLLKGTFDWLASNFNDSPQLIKKCIFYLSIFPQGSSIRRKHLVRRWIAEGYSKGTNSNSLEEEAEKLIDRLINLWIMLPEQTITVSGAMRMTSCQVNSFFLEYIISRSGQDEEKTFLPLEVTVLEGSRLTTEHIGQHLAIGRSWDRAEFVYSSLDLSRLRSLTVFGKWKPFFISDKMRVLRVLDLQDVSGVTSSDLGRMFKLLPRLKFLSLRGCSNISYLPDSLGDLRQLQTLDVRGTSVKKLPASIIKLRKLQYFRAGAKTPWPVKPPQPSSAARSWQHDLKFLSKLCRLGHRQNCVAVPRGVGSLTALHTLGVVNASAPCGMAILKELRKLTELHKLGVAGISRHNIGHLPLGSLSHLESLSLHLKEGNRAVRSDDINLHQKALGSLRSLKLHGHVENLPRSIEGLSNLMKLSLDKISLGGEEIQVLGKLKNLHTLRLRVNKVGQYDELRLGGAGQDSSGLFLGLKVLHIACPHSLHVMFGEGAMEKLELLVLRSYQKQQLLQLSGLNSLMSLKALSLRGSYNDTLEEGLQQQLNAHKNNPVLLPEKEQG